LDTTYVAAGVPHHFMNESDAPMAILYIYPSNQPGRHVVEEKA
jgi:quercetin dioxygenase-like cupin family protein